MLRLPLYPAHPERVCWGCDRYCPAGDMVCGNGSERTQHPLELFGPDWVEWAAELHADAAAPDPTSVAAATAEPTANGAAAAPDPDVAAGSRR